MPDSNPASAADPQVEPARASRVRRETIEIIQSLAGAIVIALVLRVGLFEPFTIPSSSMEPGLVTGDYIVVSKFAYGWSRASFPFNPPLFKGRHLGPGPKRGDVVVFRLPRDPKATWVKRVVGLPGDRVQVLRGTVFVNGKPLNRTPLNWVQDHDDPTRTVLRMRETQLNGRQYVTYGGDADHEGDNTGVYVVPAGTYFMMGDNRDNSLDSRWPGDLGVGFLPAENIVGRAEFILVSWRADSALLKPWTWFNLQTDRLFHVIR